MRLLTKEQKLEELRVGRSGSAEMAGIGNGKRERLSSLSLFIVAGLQGTALDGCGAPFLL